MMRKWPPPTLYMRSCKTARITKIFFRWDGLKAASKERKDLLEETQSRLRGINDLYLSFAKKASAFNSWFENVEEDMSDPVRCHSVVEIQVDKKCFLFYSFHLGARVLKQVDNYIPYIKYFLSIVFP